MVSWWIYLAGVESLISIVCHDTILCNINVTFLCKEAKAGRYIEFIRYIDVFFNDMEWDISVYIIAYSSLIRALLKNSGRLSVSSFCES